MENVEQLKQGYSDKLTVAQLATIERIEQRHGIRSIWFDSIGNMVQICTERTGMIIGVLDDGSSHS